VKTNRTITNGWYCLGGLAGKASWAVKEGTT